MNKIKEIEALLEKPYFIVDFLPEQVPESSSGNFFEIEQYFLSDDIDNIADKIARIIMKLWCYYQIEVYSNNKLCNIKCSELPKLIQRTIAKPNNHVNILIPVEKTLIHVKSDALDLTVFNPSGDVQRIMSALVVSEGLFWRKGTN